MSRAFERWCERMPVAASVICLSQRRRCRATNCTRHSRGFGKLNEAIMRDGYFLVDMTLARPEAETANPPVAWLREHMAEESPG